jgi:hypothetical protein
MRPAYGIIAAPEIGRPNPPSTANVMLADERNANAAIARHSVAFIFDRFNPFA